MKIGDIRSEGTTTRPRVAATVTWEDSDRPPLDIFFETHEAFGSDLGCDPHAFLVACMPPALRHGERRIAIDEDICPEFHDGLQTAMRLLQRWAGRSAPPPVIEARSTDGLPSDPRGARAGAFLSGGVDSLSNLWLNRSTYPRAHPRSISDCLFIQGFDVAVEDAAGFELARTSLGEVARETDVTLIPVRTNIRHLDMDPAFWMRESHGAALVSVAHALSRRLGSVSIAPTYSVDRLPFLWGSHPLLDPYYQSAGLRIHHDGIRDTRLERVGIVADWDVGLQHLRVCVRWSHPGSLNCGECEKCTRTMTALLAIGQLERCKAFEANDVPESAIDRIRIRSDTHAETWEDLIDPLVEGGRPDLAGAVERKIGTYRAWHNGKGWRGAVARLDRHGSSRVVRGIKYVDGTRSIGKTARRIFEKDGSDGT